MSGEIKLSAYNMLATHVTNIGLRKVLGDDPVWSDMDIWLGEMKELDARTVFIKARMIQLPETKECYQMTSEVEMISTTTGVWEFTSMLLFLHHPKHFLLGEDVDFPLPRGVKSVTCFTSDPTRVDDEQYAGNILLPAYTSVRP